MESCPSRQAARAAPTAPFPPAFSWYTRLLLCKMLNSKAMGQKIAAAAAQHTSRHLALSSLEMPSGEE